MSQNRSCSAAAAAAAAAARAWVDAGQWKMPVREPHVPVKLAFDLLDRVEGLPRVWALVIAVLDDQAAGG
jgi:hypothetical protein